MDFRPSNQLRSNDDEKYQRENLEDGKNCVTEEVEFQDGLSLSSPTFKAKRRRTDIIEVHSGHIVRSTGRKDRHSKVRTARGTRDRRFRLSPKTAILFYDVQDKLGYDRHSKAIDWLMKEAKAAIDALDEHPLAATHVAKIRGSTDSKNQQMLKNENGMIENVKHLNNDNHVPYIGYFNEAAAPSYNDFNSSISRKEELLLSAPLTNPSEIFDINYLENDVLQRNFSWNYSSVGSPPLHFPAAAADLCHTHIFSDREPLQFSYSRITNYSPQFPGVSYSKEELLNSTATATFKDQVNSKSSSAVSFLHYQE